MKIVNTGDSYSIFTDNLKTYDKLPAQCYQVVFSKDQGFFLVKQPNIVVGEKIYGVHLNKVEKVLRSYKDFSRNLGVILSGAKGIGKTLFSKILAKRAIEEGYPLIIVNSFIPGIADFLNSIEQEVVILFDEFDKVYSPKRGSMDNNVGTQDDPQTQMLTLFDGLSFGKKLFIITCNEIGKLSEFLVNRPGRFHYHFRFEYPNPDEIREYLMDHIPESSYDEIQQVITFSKRINLNYDCLRSIAYEISNGIPFAEAIKDLNILNTDVVRYSVKLTLNNGVVFTGAKEYQQGRDGRYDAKVGYKGCWIYPCFDDRDITFDMTTGELCVPGDRIDIEWEDENYVPRDMREEYIQLKEIGAQKLELIKEGPKSLHFKV